MSKIFNSADALIGRTPLLRLCRIEEQIGACAALVAKLESFNPAGSVKDRAAKEMLDGAEHRGELCADSVIIEATSGNTGIGLCSVAAARGYRTLIVMPDSMSEERRALMRAYGAELVLTDGKLGMTGANQKAAELARTIPHAFLVGQFSNPDNALAHYKTTGPEIFEDTDGLVDIFVSGVGSGGTVSGVGKYLKEKNPNIEIVAVEPSDSPVLSGGKSGAHKLQGIGAGFIPDALDTSVYDRVMTVESEDAFRFARMMGKREGVLVGISSGAALSAAARLACEEKNRGKTIVVLLPDTGDRYLSTELFKE